MPSENPLSNIFYKVGIVITFKLPEYITFLPEQQPQWQQQMALMSPQQMLNQERRMLVAGDKLTERGKSALLTIVKKKGRTCWWQDCNIAIRTQRMLNPGHRQGHACTTNMTKHAPSSVQHQGLLLLFQDISSPTLILTVQGHLYKIPDHKLALETW